MTTEADIKREKKIARKLRATRWWRQKCQQASCTYCSKTLAPDEVTMDHVVPLILGGRSTRDNIVVACLPCNQKKRDSNIVDWTLRG